jgi:hypothetical protein
MINLFNFNLWYFSRFKVDATGRRYRRFPVVLPSPVHSFFFHRHFVFKGDGLWPSEPLGFKNPDSLLILAVFVLPVMRLVFSIWVGEPYLPAQTVSVKKKALPTASSVPAFAGRERTQGALLP